jgi:cell division protein FtsL
VSMERIVIGSGVRMITEARKEAPVFPAVPRGWRLLALTGVLVAVALVNVWLTGMYYRAGYAVSAALEERRTLQKERELLKTEIMTLRSPARIEAIAKAELGMVEPQTDRIILVR